MAIKRKRSDDSSPLSTPSLPSSQEHSPSPFPATYPLPMDTDMPTTPFNFNVSWPARKPGLDSADLGCRTRKRFRDNRPDERIIHETTYQKLFSAQRNLPVDPTPSSQPTQPTIAPQPVQKSTLHAFWNIRAPPVQPPTFQIAHQQVVPPSWNAPRCEECDAPLQSEVDVGGADMDVDMDADYGVARSQFACGECGKNVCGTCAVVGEGRCCLQCVTTGRMGRRGW